MISALPLNEDFLSRHWLFVVATGLMFFMLQMVLTLRICLRVRRHEKVLAQLNRDFARGGDGRGNPRFLRRRFAWTHWVVSNFPSGTNTPPSNFSRDDVLQELDTRLSSSSDYLLLQRMGVMAPLLGVVLTVVGFYWLQVDEFEEQSLSGILLAVTPLISGVGAGAVLALVNQGLLHVAGHRLEILRMSARAWFDTVIWRNVALDTQPETIKAVRAMIRSSDLLAEAASRYTDGSSQIDSSTALMKEAASEFRDMVHTFTTEMKEIPAALHEVRCSTSAAASAMEELIHVGSRAVASLDVSVAAFRTALDRDFTPAAKLHYRSSKILENSVQQIGEASQVLKAGSEELKCAAQTNTAASRMMDESIRQHAVPGNRRFEEAVQELKGQMIVLNTVIGKLSSGVESMSDDFDQALDRLVRSATSFTDVIENRLSPFVTQHTRQIESADRSTQRLSETADSLSESTAALGAMLHERSQFVTQARETYDILADAARELSEAGNNLRRTIETEVAPSQQIMHDAATSFSKSAVQLSDFIDQGVVPATSRLAALHDTLAGLHDAAVAINNFSRARADIDRLNDALARTAEFNETILSLPEQIRDVLGHNSDHPGPTDNSGGRFKSWLVRRPR